MPLFLATHINKLDRKGRLSVPAAFRSQLSKEEGQQFAGFRSYRYQAIECYTMERLQHLSESVDQLALFSEDQEDLTATIFADAHQLSIENDGRIVLPRSLIDHAELTDSVAFVGCGTSFQMWQPALFEKHQNSARLRRRERSFPLHLKKREAAA